MVARDRRESAGQDNGQPGQRPVGDRRPKPSNSPGPAIKDRIVGLRWVRAEDLCSHPLAWRLHPPGQRHALRAVLEQIGWADVLIARQGPEGPVLVDGHLRRDLDPKALVPVLVIDVTEEEAEVLVASLDPIAAMAIPDQEALLEILSKVAIPEEELAEHLRGMVQDIAAPGPVDPEAIPLRPRKPAARPGQTWRLGRHVLTCGDATSAPTLSRVMGAERAVLAWTDPPYGVDYQGKTAERLRIRNDGPDGLEDLLTAAFGALDPHLAPGARLYVAHPAGPLSAVFLRCFLAQGWRLHQTLVWVKDTPVLGHADHHYRHEPVLFGYKAGPGRYGRGGKGWYGGNGQDSVFEVPRPKASPDHPTAKPVELIARHLRNSSRPGDIVADPFAGSGSTLIACEQLRRRCRAVELDPAYCDVIIARWQALTGTPAEVVDG